MTRSSPSSYQNQPTSLSTTPLPPTARTLPPPSRPVARRAVQVLREQAGKTEVPIYAYCIMPDHVHLVLDPSTSCDIVTFVGRFKNLAQRAAWREGVRGTFWQTSFWDHFLRREEQLQVVVDYVLNNPVRAGLVEQWQDYPFSGSLVFDLSE